MGVDQAAAEKAEWDAYWKVRELDSRGSFYPRARYYAQKLFDWPATFMREKVIEPLHAKNKLPYYHRTLNRVPDIDLCGVNDKACFYEANEQFRLDKMVDGFILQILRQRLDRCTLYHSPHLAPCQPVIEDIEEAELNFFIKYGELGAEADVSDAYMKQKHRLIWERRNPEVMAERERLKEEHKANLAKGDFDFAFWKKGAFFMDRKNYETPHEFFLSKPTMEGDKPVSKDWQYYKRVAQDEEFAKSEDAKEQKFPLF